MTQEKDQTIWANLLHLSYNMWEDRMEPTYEGREYHEDRGYQPSLCFDEKLWNDILGKMVDAGMNMVVIDLGDGVQYQSHPEIAVENAWTVEKLKKELSRIRGLGLEPVPKLNFATTHDAWLAEYSRCVSTDTYYVVCRDLIAEVIDIFDKPRFFHLGMDEETPGHQRNFSYMVVRQFDLWWHDLYFYCDHVTKAGVRPWVWSDYLWHNPEVFFKKMPKTVVQSNWYYGEEFDKSNIRVKAYDDLEEHGYDQIPASSNHSTPRSFGMTVDYCKQHISPPRLLGFLQTSWRVTLEKCRQRHMEAVEQVASAKANFVL
jgi:hypothetical protein